ncbi:MAG: insulinase family protein [Chitinispirillales bacterium]|jgi:zinc protease|nr:insulinase family protein [Chitinispirillales bacterium]
MNKIFLLLFFAAGSIFPQFLHPDSLKFAELNWKIPDGKNYRKTIGKIPFYYEKDNSVGIFYLQLSFEAGNLLENPQPKGASQLYSMSIRNGGSKKFSPAQIDSLLALNAVSIFVYNEANRTDFIVSGLSENKKTAFEIFEDILQNPLFDSARIAINAAKLKQNITHRFDNPSNLLSAAWKSLIYPQTPVSELLSMDFAENIMKNDLLQYHKYLMQDAKMIVAASGDIDENTVKSFVEKNFGKKRNENSRSFPEIKTAQNPQTIIIHKDGLNQSYVKTGLPSFKRPDNRYYPLTIFNEILGGGFNSRLVSRIRSDEGLTYSIYSMFGSDYRFASTFSTQFFTKIENTNHALALTREIVENTVNEKFLPDETNEKIEQFILSLPSIFRTSEDRVSTFLKNEFDGGKSNHYIEYENELRTISADSVGLEVKKFFDKKQFFTVIVTDTSMLKNLPEYNGFSIEKLNPKIIDAHYFEKNSGKLE